MLAKPKISTFIIAGIISLCFLLVSYGGAGDSVRKEVVEIQVTSEKYESRIDEKSEITYAVEMECDVCPSQLQMNANDLNEDLDAIIKEIQAQQIDQP